MKYLSVKRPTQPVYEKFIDYALKKCDVFILTYCVLKGSPVKKTQKEMKEHLKAFQIKSYRSLSWPGTKLLCEGSYQYTVRVYRCSEEAADILYLPGDFFKWEYPEYPCDLCFVRDNRVWFVVTAHEEDAYIYCQDDLEVLDLQKLGLEFNYTEDILGPAPEFTF